MGRKRLPVSEKKETITFRFPNWLITEIKKVKGYNSLIEKILIAYFGKK